MHGCLARRSGKNFAYANNIPGSDATSLLLTIDGKAAIPSQISFSSETETLQVYAIKSRLLSTYHSDTPEPFSVIVAICCGGFEAADPALANFYPITTPTLHIIGKNDTIVTEERSRTLIRRCEDYRIEIHEGSKCLLRISRFCFVRHC